MPFFFSMIFLIKSNGIIENANMSIISNSYIERPVVLKSEPPKYIRITCTIAMKRTIDMNTLFLSKLENVFILYVLALNALNIVMKINNPKKAVIIYLFDMSV